MDPMTMAMLGMAGSNIFGSLMSANSAGDALASQQELMSKMQQYYDSIPLPEQKALFLQRLQQQGNFTPESLNAIKMGNTSYNNIKVNPAYQDAQMKALAKLSGIANEGGLTSEDKANMFQTQTALANKNKAAADTTMRNMQARGIGGSGLGLAAQLQAQQGNYDTAAMEGLNTNAMAQKRALESLMNLGQMGTSMRGQDYNEQSQAAQAQDMINRFNTQNQMSANQYNVDARNRAAQMNLAERQRIADANSGLTNQERQYNNEAEQRNFQNQIARGNGRFGLSGGMMQAYGNYGNSMGNMYGNLGQGLGRVAYGAGNYYGNQQNKPLKAVGSGDGQYGE